MKGWKRSMLWQDTGLPWVMTSPQIPTADLNSRKLVNFCFRENKVKAFRERYPDAVVENFYTDSYNDQPMIDLAQNAYLVRGDRLVKIK